METSHVINAEQSDVEQNSKDETQDSPTVKKDGTDHGWPNP
jgi:hypothetical protein